eukprot:s3328_g4.t1
MCFVSHSCWAQLGWMALVVVLALVVLYTCCAAPSFQKVQLLESFRAMAQKLSEIWPQVLQHIAARSYEEASALVDELRALGASRRGPAAIAAAEVAAVLLSITDKEAVVDFIKAAASVDASWSNIEAPATSPWAELASKARALAEGRSFDLESAKALGVLWSPDLRPAVLSLGSAPAEEPVDPSSAATPEQRRRHLKALLLLRAARMSDAAPVDAAKDAKDCSRRLQALSTFRDLSHAVGEATALLAVSHAALDADIQGAQSAANQALKLFRELGHLKGQAFATYAAALADKAWLWY